VLRKLVDDFLISSLRLRLRPVERGIETRGCRRIGKLNGWPPERVALPAKGAIFSSDQTVRLNLGRYAERARETIGTVGPGQDGILRLEQDDGSVPWFISAEPGTAGTLSDVVVCRYRNSG